MKKDEYVTTLNICGKEIKLGLDDCGQCYFVEWLENGETKSMGLGTYNFHYMSDIYYMFDPVYKELSKKDFRNQLVPEEKKQFDEYKKLFSELEEKF